jgi:hypothetical protein
MPPRNLHRIRHRQFSVAALAMAVILPPHVAACCGARPDLPQNTRPHCCHAGQIASDQQSVPVGDSPSSLAIDSFCGMSEGACQCVCCRPADQRNVPLSGAVADNVAQDLFDAHITPLAFVTAANASPASDQNFALDAAPIPHRILHCSWII